jgi:hypothetical protein
VPPFFDDCTEPLEVEPPTLVEQALELVADMRPDELVEFVDGLRGAGIPSALGASRQSAELALALAQSAEVP